MKTLQEILDEFAQTKLGKVKETVISHIVGAQRASEVRLKMWEERRLEKESNPKFIEEKKLKMEKHKEGQKERGKRLGEIGKKNLTDYSREMSKVPTTCPNCNTVGPLSNMRQHHMDNCKRTTGYSDDLIIENHKTGMTASQISKDSNVSYAQTKLIIRKYQKSLAGK
jgi:hypothetical protein